MSILDRFPFVQFGSLGLDKVLLGSLVSNRVDLKTLEYTLVHLGSLWLIWFHFCLVALTLVNFG